MALRPPQSSGRGHGMNQCPVVQVPTLRCSAFSRPELTTGPVRNLMAKMSCAGPARSIYCGSTCSPLTLGTRWRPLPCVRSGWQRTTAFDRRKTTGHYLAPVGASTIANVKFLGMNYGDNTQERTAPLCGLRVSLRLKTSKQAEIHHGHITMWMMSRTMAVCVSFKQSTNHQNIQRI